MSISSTSGRSARATSTAGAPSAASPTTVMSLGMLEDRPQPGPHQRLVVGDGGPDHRSCHRRRGAAPRHSSRRRRTDRRQRAAVQLDPLPHPDRAVRPPPDWYAGCECSPTAAVVLDLDHQIVLAPPGLQTGPWSARVPDDVGQCLLDHPIGRQRHTRRDSLEVALGADVNGQPAAATLATSVGRSASPGPGSAPPRPRSRRAAR